MRLDEFYNPEQDEWSQRAPEDTRTPKLTLRTIQSLRKYREHKKVANMEAEALASVMYTTPAEDSGGL